MSKPKIFACYLDPEKYTPGERLSYFYLHGQAEAMNEWDICNGDIEAFAQAIGCFTFFADLVCLDGTIKECLVCSYYEMRRVHGRIVLANDSDAIKDVFKNHFTEWPPMYDTEKDKLSSEYPDQYKVIRDILKAK